MPAPKGRSKILPPLQKRIILYLAKHKPRTINEINSGINPTARNKSHCYKSTWTAFDTLKKKGMTKGVKFRTYRGNKYPLYWLTDLGVFTSLVEGADTQDLLEKTIEIYPNNKILQCCLKIAPFTGIEGYRIALSTILSKGKLEQSDLTKIMLTQMQKDPSIDQIKQSLEMLKEFPEVYEKVHKQIKQYADLLKEIGEMM